MPGVFPGVPGIPGIPPRVPPGGVGGGGRRPGGVGRGPGTPVQPLRQQHSYSGKLGASSWKWRAEGKRSGPRNTRVPAVIRPSLVPAAQDGSSKLVASHVGCCRKISCELSGDTLVMHKSWPQLALRKADHWAGVSWPSTRSKSEKIGAALAETCSCTGLSGLLGEPAAASIRQDLALLQRWEIGGPLATAEHCTCVMVQQCLCS